MSTLQKTSPKKNIDSAIKSLRLAYDELQTTPDTLKVSEHLHKAISFVETIITILPEKKDIETEDSPQEKIYKPELFPVEELLAPLPGENPAGKNAKVTGDFTLLSSYLVNKARKPDFKPNYTEAIKKSQDILKNCGKDMGVNVLLIESAVQLHGFRAVTEGLLILNGLMSKYWDGLYPEAEDGDCEYRANEIENLQRIIILKLKARYGEAHEFTPHFKTKEESENENLVLETMLKEFKTLKQFIHNHFGNQAPHLGELQKTIALYAKKVKAQYQIFIAEDKQKTDSLISRQGKTLDVLIGSKKKESDTKGKGLSFFPFGGKKDKSDIKPESNEEALNQIIQCARYLVSSFPNDPLGYHLNRAVRWFSEKRSPLNFLPDPNDKDRLTTLYSDKQWQDVLTTGEEIFMNNGDQWLDLQRFSYEAARNLGGKFILIANIISLNTKNYLSKDRKILDMKFPDQSLIADQKTKEWILKEIEKNSYQTRKPEVPNKPETNNDHYKVEIEKAMDIAKKGDLFQAVNSMLANVDKAQSGREKFLWRLHVVELCLKLNITKYVIPTIEDLANTVDDLHLKNWENKDLICRVYNAGYEGYLKLFGPQKAPKDRVDYFYNCLCLCNPGYFIKKK